MAAKIATIKIAKDLKMMQEDPVEGIYCELVDDNLFDWKIYIEGPGDSPYQGGVFEAQMIFPKDYPMSPPNLRFISDFWHPNVYTDGRVCISILHPPGTDALNPDERPEERWLPTQTVSTIMLSVISMLNAPNINSPANVDASVEWRDNRSKFNERCRKIVARARPLPPHIKIPHPDTDPLEREKKIEKLKLESKLNSFSIYDDEDCDGDGDEYGDEYSGEEAWEDQDGEEEKSDNKD